jgi:hypothetical protein
MTEPVIAGEPVANGGVGVNHRIEVRANVEAGPGCRSGCTRLASQDSGDLYVAPITTTGGLDAASGQRGGQGGLPQGLCCEGSASQTQWRAKKFLKTPRRGNHREARLFL